MLLGLTLEGGWKVTEKLVRPAYATGGHFSMSYAVESSSGRRGFLKALDYSSVFLQPDVPRALEAMTSAYNYERDLLRRCVRMSRVVTSLADGEIRKPGWILPVNYLIFEWAAQDSRAVLDTSRKFDIAWRLRTLHQASVGLQQLHAQRIAHQDLKPSNLLIFGDEESKIADLGRSSYRGSEGPFDMEEFPGDWKYAPPEFLYGRISQDWTTRRLASDMYQLGSLVMFFFGGSGTTSSLLAQLNRRHAPQHWTGTYQEVLPFVRQAFVKSISMMEATVPDTLKAPIARMVGELCDPDPNQRGHPKNRIGHLSKYGLERYVSQFNLLARKVELGILPTTG